MVEPDFLLDVRKSGLPLPLKAGTAIPLYSGFVREISFWVHPESGTELWLQIEGAQSRQEPVRLVEGQWSFQQVVVGESATVSLVAKKDVQVRLTRLQVLP